MYYNDAIAAGAYGDWRSDTKETWRIDVGRDLKPSERYRIDKRLEAIRRQLNAQRESEQKAASTKVESILRALRQANPNHPYLLRKSIRPHGARMDSHGNIVIPIQFLHAKPDDDVLYLSFPKISYASKFKNTVWFKRKGWTFEYAIETRRPQEEIDAALADQLERWLTSQLKEGRRYTKTEIENGAIYESFNMKRTEFRKALVMLRAEGRVIDKELPEGEKKGVRNKFLFCPAGCGGND